MPDVAQAPHFPCPCCGHRTFVQQPPDSWEICPVCFWEDAPGNTSPAESSGVSLVEAQRNYLRIGACAARWASEVRPALPHEARPDGWQSIDARRPVVSTQLQQQLEATFGEVRRDGGITLHQAHVLDAYGGPEAMAAAATQDPEERWQDIPEDKLARLDGAFPFFDAAGYRFHIPAYLRLYARHLVDNDGAVPSPGLWWYSLDGGDFYRGKHYAQLDDAQQTTIASFLRAVADVGAPDEAADAAKFLESYWGVFLD